MTFAVREKFHPVRHAIYPGSFDPLTNGHVDVIQRSLKIVDKITVAVLRNSGKKNLFSPEERMDLVNQVFKDEPRVVAESFTGLMVDFCKEHDTNLVLRGLRAVSDFDYEHAIFLTNNSLFQGLETIFLMSKSENSFISSSIVKEVNLLGGDVSGQVPPIVNDWLKKKKIQD